MKRTRLRPKFDLPEFFVLRYHWEINQWLMNYKKIGAEKTIVLSEGNLSDMSPEPEQGAVLLGVRLKAEIERMTPDEMTVVISARDERDERVIRNHCQKMEAVGIRPESRMVEPPRPGLPIFPTVHAKPIEDDNAGTQ